MLDDLFSRCTSELCSEQFNRLNFLKSAAELASKPEAKVGLLTIFSFYHFLYHRNFKLSLECIQQGLSLKPEDVTTSMLLSIKGAVLTCMDKHSQALHILKQAFQIASSAVFIEEQPHIRKIYPQIMTKVLSSLNLSRGRRQFLIFLDGIRVQAGNLSGLEDLQRIASLRVAQIREQMRCGCREQSQDKMMNQNQFTTTKREQQSHTNIYINRLYQQRKKALGKRDNSANKNKVIDPYQWRTKQKQKSEGQCQYM